MGFPKEVYIQGNLNPTKGKNKFSQLQSKSSVERANRPIGISEFIQHQITTGKITIGDTDAGSGGIYEGSGDVDINTVATVDETLTFTLNNATHAGFLSVGPAALGAAQTLPVGGIGGFFEDIASENQVQILAVNGVPFGADDVFGKLGVLHDSRDDAAFFATSYEAGVPVARMHVESEGATDTFLVLQSLTADGDSIIRVNAESTGTGQPSIQFTSTRGAGGGEPAVELTVDDNGTTYDLLIAPSVGVKIGLSTGVDDYTLPLTFSNTADDILTFDAAGIGSFSDIVTILGGIGTALTAADANALNTGDATSDLVITNMRTRIGELEAVLQGQGLLT